MTYCLESSFCEISRYSRRFNKKKTTPPKTKRVETPLGRCKGRPKAKGYSTGK